MQAGGPSLGKEADIKMPDKRSSKNMPDKKGLKSMKDFLHDFFNPPKSVKPPETKKVGKHVHHELATLASG